MSNKEKLSNEELKEVSGGYYMAEKTVVNVTELPLYAENTNVPNVVQSELAYYEKSDVRYSIDANNAHQSMDNMFAQEKKGIAAIIENIIKSLKNLFKF